MDMVPPQTKEQIKVVSVPATSTNENSIVIDDTYCGPCSFFTTLYIHVLILSNIIMKTSFHCYVYTKITIQIRYKNDNIFKNLCKL